MAAYRWYARAGRVWRRPDSPPDRCQSGREPVCGGEENRTPVQTYSSKVFYMFIPFYCVGNELEPTLAKARVDQTDNRSIS